MKEFFVPSKIIFGGNSKDPADPRLKNIIKKWQAGEAMDAGIVGIPFDRGVFLSGGRPGASKAPDAIRAEIKRYGTAYNIEYAANLKKIRVADCGNIRIISNDSSAVHRRITEAIKYVLGDIGTVITLGGGNDVSYATIKGLAEIHHARIGGANIDAHFDVRPVVSGRLTSGTPYRRLLEDGLMDGSKFFEIGTQGHINARSHYQWLKNRRAHIIFLNELRRAGVEKIWKSFQKMIQGCSAAFVSIDIDSVAQAFAPGSSAPNPDGLFPQDILRLAYLSGETPHIRLFEIMEVNPKYDADNRTSRLAANIISEFLAGFIKRKPR